LLLASDGGIERWAGTRFKWIGGPRHGLDADQITEMTGQYVAGRAEPDLFFATWHNSLWSTRGEHPRGNDGGEGFVMRVPPSAAGDSASSLTYTSCAPCSNQIADTSMRRPADWPDAEDGVGQPELIQPNSYVQATSTGMSYTTNEGRDWRKIAVIRDR